MGHGTEGADSPLLHSPLIPISVFDVTSPTADHSNVQSFSSPSRFRVKSRTSGTGTACAKYSLIAEENRRFPFRLILPIHSLHKLTSNTHPVLSQIPDFLFFFLAPCSRCGSTLREILPESGASSAAQSKKSKSPSSLRHQQLILVTRLIASPHHNMDSIS